jgi:D-alanyl-lipoteichoic acid acyltransferase DltB (MBOAT superfamily)
MDAVKLPAAAAPVCIVLFNSFEYIFVFLPLVALGFHALRARGMYSVAGWWLLTCSLVYYAWGAPAALPLLLGSIVFNFSVARRLGSSAGAPSAPPGRGLVLAAGVAGNLVFLGYFKYVGHLPLGISFFTLTQVMYLVDAYERLVTPSTLPMHALCTSFFATVTMGPLVRVRELRPQLTDPRPAWLDAATFARAIAVFVVGLFKKVLLADSFGRLADAAFAVPAALSIPEAWAGSAAYSLQLYFDFSGYSDMALASALFLGVAIPVNFNSPYHARSIVEFWTRWHISLSRFITTYLYTPLVRSFRKLTFGKAMLATFVSMVIVGLWHGSTWNFIIFGALHGIGLVTNQTWKRLKFKLPAALAWTLTAAYINLAFIFFRAPTVHDAVQLIGSLVNAHSLSTPFSWALKPQGADMNAIKLPLAIGLIVACQRKNSATILNEFKPSWRNLVWLTATALVALLYLNSKVAKEFLYIDF